MKRRTHVPLDDKIAVRGCDSISREDFEKARKALIEADVKGPFTVYVDGWTPEQWKLYEMMEEMADEGKEEMGVRSPGEKGSLER